MKAIRLYGPRDLRMVDLPDDPIGPREVRLESIVSAVSHGTEMNTYRGTAPLDSKRFDPELRCFVPDDASTTYPATLGYEMVARVVETGDAVTEFAVGDVVHTGTPHQTHVITSPDEYRGFYPMLKLPEHDTHDPGLFVSLGAVALQATHDASPKVGDRVVLSGAGAIGLMATQLLAMSGAEVLVVEPNEHRRQQALEAGASTVLDPTTTGGFVGKAVKDSFGGFGADIAVETSGSYDALHSMIASVGVAGTVVAVGFYQGEGKGLRLGEEWHHNRVTMKSSMGVWDCPHRDYPLWTRERLMETVVELLYSGRLRTNFMGVQRRQFTEAIDVYKELDNAHGEHMKLAFEY